MGSLLVGTSFAKGFALGLDIPMIDVNHLQAHVLAHFVQEPDVEPHLPEFPFLCLLVSGGNSQIILVKSYKEMQVLGQTIDDAAGEAFDKCAKVMGLPYPGGPYIDKYAKMGDAKAFAFAKPHIKGFDYSFSGLKTSFLYTLRDAQKEEPNFVENHLYDLCASLQKTVVDILMDKVHKAMKETGVKHLAVAGGVSANSGLRDAFVDYGRRHKVEVYIPKFSFTTDNAAMVAITGHFKYLDGDFCAVDLAPYARNLI
jgi:N6-L-threonylcarbamoyladenine synthase